MAQYINFVGGYGVRNSPVLGEYEITLDFLVEGTGTQVLTSTADSLDSFIAFRIGDNIGINNSNGDSATDYQITDPTLLPITGKRLQLTVRCEQVSTNPTVVETTVTLSDGVNTQVITTNDDKRGMDFDLIFARGDSLLGTQGRLYGFSITSISNNTDTLLHSYVAPESGSTMVDTAGSEDTEIVGSFTLENDTVEPSPIAVNNFPELFYQRAKRGARTLTFSGTYTGTPTELEFRIIDTTNDSVTQDWAVFDSNPSGGTFSHSFDAQGSINPHIIEVRFSNETATTAEQSQGWTVGDIILIAGQSLALDFRTDGSVAPLDGYDHWNGSAFTGTSTGEGAWQIANAIIQSEGVAVKVINTSVGSTPLTVHAGEVNYWNDPTGSLWADTLTEVQQATNSVNEIAFFYWHQGNNDAKTGVTQAQYKQGLDEFFGRVRNNIRGGEGETLPIFISTLGRDTRGNPADSFFDGIRQAEYAKATEDANIYPINTYSSEMPDGVHFSVPAYGELGQRIAATYYQHRGVVATGAPRLLNLSQGNSANELDLNFDSNLKADDPYSVEGIRVTDDAGDLTVTSFVRKSPTVATITTAAIPSGTVRVCFSYGAGGSVNALNYPKSEDITIPNTAITTNQDAFAVFSEEITAQVADVTPPVITLLGSASVAVTEGGAYTDAGATAFDNVDGDITSSIVVTNPVNINAVGAYTVRYNVSDSSGNAADEVTRAVIVEAEQQTNQPPAANAGVNQSVAAGATVTLDGSGSSDSDGTIVSYAWSQTAGAAVTLTSANTAKPSFTAPSANTVQTLTFELTLTDDGGLTAYDSVSVQVAAQVVQSTLNATLTGAPDGTYKTRVVDIDNGEILFMGSKVWVNETASFTLADVAAGTNVEYYAHDDTNAGLDVGVTE